MLQVFVLGSYIVCVYVDVQNVVDEKDEINNVFLLVIFEIEQFFDVQDLELVVVFFIVVVQGNNVMFNGEIKNEGVGVFKECQWEFYFDFIFVLVFN